MTEIVKASELHREIVEAKTVPEIKRIRDKLAAAAKFIEREIREGKAKGLLRNVEMLQWDIRRLDCEAVRQGGKIVESASLRRGRKSNNGVAFRWPDLGIVPQTGRRWRDVARLPEREFRALLAVDPSLKKLYDHIAEKRRAKAQEEAQLTDAQGEGRIEDLAEVLGRCRAVYADPPWSYRDSKPPRGGVDFQYQTMSLDDICALPVGDLGHEKGSHLWMWTTWPMIREGQPHRVVEAWGYRWVGEIVWRKMSTTGMKRHFGVGRWLRPATEVLVFAVKGKQKLLSTSKFLDGFVEHARGRHSEKPEHFYQIIETLSPGPRIELFARRAREGWWRWGNQA